MEKRIWNNAYLFSYVNENAIVLVGDYVDAHIIGKTKITGKCKTEGCEGIFTKKFRTLVEYESPFCFDCVDKIRCEKMRATNVERIGVEYHLQIPENVEKLRATMVERHGHEHSLQIPEYMAKFKATSMEHWGTEHPSQHETVKQQIRETSMQNWGYPSPLQSPIVQEMRMNTNMELYGATTFMHSPEGKEMTKQTNMERYGHEHSAQSPQVRQKMLQSSFASREYVFPSGRVAYIQGYEDVTLNYLLAVEGVDENDIITHGNDMPTIDYVDADGKNHVYHPDIFIPSENRIIEVKSEYILYLHAEQNKLKFNATRARGYNFELWLYNQHKERVEIPPEFLPDAL